MNTGKFVFSQVTDFVNKYEFNKCVKCYFGDYRSHELNSWNHFLQLLFGQMTGLHSINSICFCLKAHRKNLYHLGIRQFVNVSTLWRAGESRNTTLGSNYCVFTCCIHQTRTQKQAVDLRNNANSGRVRF